MSRERSFTGSGQDPHLNMNQPGPISPQGYGRDIVFDDIAFGDVVGRGAFGVVNKAVWKGMHVAVKTMEGEDASKALNKEFHQLSRLQHENIIRLFGVCARKPKVCLIMEYAEGGSLYDVLHPSGQDNQYQYTIGHVMSWALQCARAMAYLHGFKPTPIVHRDLKPPNMLLKERGTVLKICDFGTARPHDTSHMTSNKGSAAWMAPEVFEGPVYSEKCDVFSFSIVLWEMITRRKPFDNIGPPPFRIMWAVHSGSRPPMIRGIPKIFEHLIICAWSKDTKIRPPFSAIVTFLEKASKYVTGGDIPLTIMESTERRDSESGSSFDTQDSYYGQTIQQSQEEKEVETQIDPSVEIDRPDPPLPTLESPVFSTDVEQINEKTEILTSVQRKPSSPGNFPDNIGQGSPVLPPENLSPQAMPISPYPAENKPVSSMSTTSHISHDYERSQYDIATSPSHLQYPLHAKVPDFMVPQRNEPDWYPNMQPYSDSPASYYHSVRRTTSDDSGLAKHYPKIDYRPELVRYPYPEPARDWLENQHYQDNTMDMRYSLSGDIHQAQFRYRFPNPNNEAYPIGTHNNFRQSGSFSDEKFAHPDKHFQRLSPRPPYHPGIDPGTTMSYVHGPKSVSPQSQYVEPVPLRPSRLHTSSIPEYSCINELTPAFSRLDFASPEKHDSETELHKHKFMPVTPGSARSSSSSSPMTSPFPHPVDPLPIKSSSTPAMHEHEKKLWHLIEPEVEPVRPIINNKDSVRIYEQHTQLYNDYIDLQKEMSYLIERKQDLKQQLDNEKMEQQRSAVYLRDYLKLLEEKVTLSEFLTNVKEEMKRASESRRNHENVL